MEIHENPLGVGSYHLLEVLEYKTSPRTSLGSINFLGTLQSNSLVGILQIGRLLGKSDPGGRMQGGRMQGGNRYVEWEPLTIG